MTITAQQNHNLNAFIIRFRDRVKQHYGDAKGYYIFGVYASSIIGNYVKGKSDDEIFDTLIEWADDTLWNKIVTRSSTGCYDKNRVELFLGDKVRYNLEGSHTKKEYWNPEYEIIFEAPYFGLKHIGGGLDGGSHQFKLKHGGANGDLEKIG